MRLTIRQLAKAVQSAPKKSAISSQLAEEVDKYAQYNPTTLTLDNFVKFAATKSPANASFKFLSKELPVRFANIMKEFRLLPDQLHNTPSFRTVEDWYQESFSEILQFKDVHIDSDGTLEKFNATLDTLLRRHESVVETMAEGVLEMKERYGNELNERHMQKRIQYFLDRFYLNRIGIRMIIHQHRLLFAEEEGAGNHIGAIDPHCDVQAIAERAYDDARFLCEQYYLSAPECKFVCRSPFEKDKKLSDRITMTYVPTHLYHMLFELLKNSLRAVVETHREKNELPELKILICRGRGDITIKISDQGGGIRRTELPSLFNYTYSTAPRPDEHERTPLAGYGYGLPLSHLYARYFNGDLWLNSVDGFGTDAMICLKLLPTDASELLPVYNKTAHLKYSDSADHVSDWSDPLQNRGVDNKRSTVGV